MPSKLIFAVLISVTSIFTLIWQQDQISMFIGMVSLISIILVTAGGALTAICVETNTGDHIAVKAQAFATGSILMAVVATLVGLVALLANLDNVANIGQAFAGCFLCPLWAAVYKFLCNLIITSRS
mgnify:FL=1|tara:strand:+ start:405 stop:782 length:378 start_codon:yes stop_codon:yes gene_type:complete